MLHQGAASYRQAGAGPRPTRGHAPVAEPAPRTLIIGIDAVPYDLVCRLRCDRAAPRRLFAGFKGPTAVNSTFPSISYTAWSNLLKPLGSDKPLGYETRYFDGAERRLKGGLSLAEVPASWKDTFDWKMHGLVRTAVAYGWPRHYSIWELRRGLEAFAASPAPVFSMYIVSTDGLAHLSGPDALAEVLRAVDAALTDFRQAHPQVPFHSVLLSDHGIAGGRALENHWPAVRRAVRRAGFRVRSRIANDRDVVFNPYGLLTGFVIYTARERETEVAAAAAAVAGVDFAAHRIGKNAWRIHSAGGEAVIERRRAGAKYVWRYRCEGADPLRYQPVIAGLRQRAGDPAAEWFPDAWWFEHTRDQFYPDALHRLAQSFEIAVTPASIVCSCAPGYMFGGLKTEYISRATVGRLKWSHGALHRDASLGFMMSDLPGWVAPEMVRAEDALTTITAAVAAEKRIAGAV